MQIGLKHGKEAKTELQRALVFYENLFKETAGLSWPAVCDTAAKFEQKLQAEWPQYCEEIKGKVLVRYPKLDLLACVLDELLFHGPYKADEIIVVSYLAAKLERIQPFTLSLALQLSMFQAQSEPYYRRQH